MRGKNGETGSPLLSGLYLLFHGGTFPQGRIQNFFADPQMGGSDFQQFVGIDKIQGLFHGKNFGRDKTQGFVRTGGTGIGQLLFLTHIYLYVLASAGLAHHHSGINFFSRADEQGTAFLGVEQAIGDSVTCFKGDEGSLPSVLDISLVGGISIENGIHDAVSLGVCEKFAPVTDESP